MVFWIIAAFITIACVTAALLPLVRKTEIGADSGGHDIEVYKDQLAEIERDASQGAISEADAETARTEVSRRILKAGKDADRNALPDSGARMRGVSAIAIAAVVPIVSWALYSRLGAPDLPDQPVSARVLPKPDENSIESLLAKAEEHLAENPKDGRGWEVLAPIYARKVRLTTLL